jgi:cytoplasmic iron level regulating protein YaaA (DUF328/UPF0246 family)
MAIVYLITCVKTKDPLPGSRQARNLYPSAYFRGMRALAEAKADRWYILSDKYGLLRPDDLVEWYEVDLKLMRPEARSRWAVGVLQALGRELSPGDPVVMLAGSLYVDLLSPRLKTRGFAVDDPMHGMRIGERVAWLQDQVLRGAADVS